jgi:hypothetical protein
VRQVAVGAEDAPRETRRLQRHECDLALARLLVEHAVAAILRLVVFVH